MAVVPHLRRHLRHLLLAQQRPCSVHTGRLLPEHCHILSYPDSSHIYRLQEAEWTVDDSTVLDEWRAPYYDHPTEDVGLHHSATCHVSSEPPSAAYDIIPARLHASATSSGYTSSSRTLSISTILPPASFYPVCPKSSGTKASGSTWRAGPPPARGAGIGGWIYNDLSLSPVWFVRNCRRTGPWLWQQVFNLVSSSGSQLETSGPHN